MAQVPGVGGGGGGGGQHQVGIPETPEDRKRRQLKVYQAAVKGDWKAASQFFTVYPPEIIDDVLTPREETALLVAILAEKTEFVRELVGIMTVDHLACVDLEGRSALYLAALTGKVELARVIINKKPDLARSRTKEGILPIQKAAFLGHREMVEFLHTETKHHHMEDQDRLDLLVGLINSDMFDIALDVLPTDKETLLFEEDIYKETPLTAIARKPQMLSKSGLFSRLCSKTVQNDAGLLLRRIWETLAIKEEAIIKDAVGAGWRTIFLAVENGNVEFLRIIIDCYPDLVTKTNDKGQTIFHFAILHRQKEIFRLIHEIGSMKTILAGIIDEDGNHMLHLAAQLAPPHRLQSIKGEAFQLRDELLWYQEVEAVVGSRVAKERQVLQNRPQTQGNTTVSNVPQTQGNTTVSNVPQTQGNITVPNESQFPRDIFIKKHEDMIYKGQEHVKKTAESSILVAVLVTTLAFAAAYTVAGGPDQNTGYPIFLHDVSFKIFTVADAVSLIFSVASVLTFLSLLTSSNALDEFVWWVPTKLLIGFFTLFVALISMMVAFVSVFFVYFKQHHAYLKYGVPVAVASSLPPLLFGLVYGRIFPRMKLKSTLFASH